MATENAEQQTSHSTAERDRHLDAYRAWTMVYIVCIVHLIYWLFPPEEKWWSLLLFEMPAIFFIAGASVRLAHPKNFRQTLENRLHRVALPYYRYAGVSLFLLFLTCLLVPSLVAPHYTFSDWIKVLVGYEIPGFPFSWHLWFILPYLLISVLFVHFRRLLDHHGLLCLLAVAILICSTHYAFKLFRLDLVELVGWRKLLLSNATLTLCYSFFYFSGYLFYRRLTVNRTIIVFVTSLFLLILLTHGQMPNLQTEKFRGSPIFVTYGVMVLSLLSLILRWVHLPYPRVIALWNTHGYGIYLYQNYIYLFVSILLMPLFTELPRLLCYPLCSITLLGLTTLSASICRSINLSNVVHRPAP